jgi:hypothetical protein
LTTWNDLGITWDSTIAQWNQTFSAGWATHAARGKRTPCVVVEVDLDWIDDGSVTATNPDGSLCYRTPATTDQGTLPAVTKTRRWQSANVKALPELGAIPCVQSVRMGGEEVRVGRGLGYFGSATVAFGDFVDNDAREEDPFSGDASRTGLDLSAGTFWSKLLARNPWWENRPIRIIEGWATDGVWHPADTLVHYFRVRDIQGPNDGKVTLTAVGPLQLLNLKDTEAPKASGGTLAADITDVATAATLSSATAAADYPTSGLARIGDEIVSFTRSGTALTLVRGQQRTTAEAHFTDDAVQVCLSYTATPLVEILEDLLTTYGGIDAALLDLAGWAAEQAAYLTLYDLSGVVSAPAKVMDLVQELLEASGSILWWDDQTNLVKFKAVRPSVAAVATWTDRFHLLSRTASRTEPTERVSRCDVAIELRDPTKDAKELGSYRVRVVGLPQGEEATQYGSPKVKVLTSRWLSANQASLALRASWLVTSQLRDGRRTIDVEVSAKDAYVQIGEVVALQSRDLVDRRGQVQTVRGLVIKREPVREGSAYRYTLDRQTSGGRFIHLCPVGLPDYPSATASQRDPGWFLAPAGGGPFGVDDPPYVLG